MEKIEDTEDINALINTVLPPLEVFPPNAVLQDCRISKTSYFITDPGFLKETP